MKRFWLPLTYLALGAALTLVACGDDDDDTTPLKGAGGKAGAGGKSGAGGSGMGASGAGGSGMDGAGGGGGSAGGGGSGTGGSGTGGSAGSGTGGSAGSGTGGSAGSGTGGSAGSGTGGSAGGGGSGTGGSGTGGSAGGGGSGTGGSGTGGSGTGGSGTGGSGGGGPIVINEVVFNPPGTDAGCYIELKGTPGASLSGHTLRSVNGNGGTTITEFKFESANKFDANGYFVIAQDNTVALPGGAASIINAAADLQNGPDNLVLLDPGGATIDALGYADGAGKFDPPNVFVGEGKFALAPPSTAGSDNVSLSRLPNGGDTNDNATDFGVGTRTPGAANVVAPTVGFCNIQFPATICSTPNNATGNIYTQIYVAGVTDASGTPAAGIKASIGFGPGGSDPRTAAGWAFTDATPNVGFDFNQNNDEYQATLPAQASIPAAPFSYVYRITYNGGPPLFCDINGTSTIPPNQQPFELNQLGTWTVAANCP